MAAEGGCLCRGVRYRIDGEVGPAGYCHCADCRKLTGSPFGISSPVAIQDFVIESGNLGAFTKQADSGRSLTRYFCPDCGSPIYTWAPDNPDVAYVKAGTFDEPELIHPTLEAWCGSRVDWAVIPQDLAQFEKGRFA
ncbi:GFA family protein [Altererythrobacter sp. Root672]|uniref:GFA family protein n=1 Tax=Altererythrobacter sp. Root672 TaxID=1736584 RepID=UPI0006FD30EA|nr:GFA family protein [Altererythrobacter sp. Root672]KRA80524.1 hypothetical protein ASD76_15285 [Altererythrobacter sp. Root672]